MSELSRRDFIKLMGAFGVALSLDMLKLPNFLPRREIRDLGLLEGARLWLRLNEAIPKELSADQIPLSNPNFMFADEILNRALSVYHAFRDKDQSLPKPHFAQPVTWMGMEDIKDVMVSVADDLVSKILMPWLERGETPLAEIIGQIKSSMSHIPEAVGDRIIDTFYQKENQSNFSPYTFSGNNSDLESYLKENPGSGILRRAQEWVTKGYLPSEAVKYELLRFDNLYDQAIIQIGDQLDPGQLIGLAMVFNNGNVSESMWDATLVTKVWSRGGDIQDANNLLIPNDAPFAKSSFFRTIYRVKDVFAPRISANWLGTKNSLDYLIDYAEQDYLLSDLKTNLKPFDKYSSLGNIYRNLTIMSLATCTDYRFLTSAILYVYTYNDQKGNFPELNQAGLEKFMSSLMVIYKAKDLQNILGIASD